MMVVPLSQLLSICLLCHPLPTDTQVHSAFPTSEKPLPGSLLLAELSPFCLRQSPIFGCLYHCSRSHSAAPPVVPAKCILHLVASNTLYNPALTALLLKNLLIISISNTGTTGY